MDNPETTAGGGERSVPVDAISQEWSDPLPLPPPLPELGPDVDLWL
jgi:hypothetical protein